MFCPSCGTQIPDDSAFCLKCGRSMSLAPKAVLAEQPTAIRFRRRSPSPIGRVLIVVVALAVLVGFFAYLKDRPLEAGTEKTKAENPRQTSPTKTEPPPPLKLSPGEIAAKYADAVVVLDNYDDQGQRASQGSGFISSANGLVLTNYHVVRVLSASLRQPRSSTTGGKLCDPI